MSWHIGTLAWEAYAAGRLDPAAELSVEAHLTDEDGHLTLVTRLPEILADLRRLAGI